MLMLIYPEVEKVREYLVKDGMDEKVANALALFIVLVGYYGRGDALAGIYLMRLYHDDRVRAGIEKFLSKCLDRDVKLNSYIQMYLEFENCLAKLSGKYPIIKAFSMYLKDRSISLDEAYKYVRKE